MREANAAVLAKAIAPGRTITFGSGHAVRVKSVSFNGAMLEVVLESATVPLNNPYLFVDPPIKVPTGAKLVVASPLGGTVEQVVFAADAANTFDRIVKNTVRMVAGKRGVRV